MRRGNARKSAQRRSSIGNALGNDGRSGLCPTAVMDDSLERASEGLIPRLRGGDTAHHVLAVAHIEIEMGEELLLRQRVGRVDTEVGGGPGRVHTRRTAHLNAPPDTQAIGQAGLERGGYVEIALALELLPEGFPQRGASYLTGAGARDGIVGPGKVGPGAALGQVGPGPPPGALKRRHLELPPGRPPTAPAPPGPHDG